MFGLFVIFDGNLAKILAPPSDVNENHACNAHDRAIRSEQIAENGIKIDP